MYLSLYKRTHKTVARMYALAALALGDLDNAVAVQISRRVAQIEGVRAAERVLGLAVGVGVERGDLDAVLRGCAADSTVSHILTLQLIDLA